MLQLRLGIDLASLRMPLKAGIAQAGALGVAAVEIDLRHDLKPRELSETGVRHLLKLLEDQRLRVAAVAFPTRRGYGTAEGLDQRVAATQEAMSLAAKLGTRVVVNHVGHVPADLNSGEGPLLLQTLRDLGRHGQRIGATLAARTGGQSGADLAQLIQTLPGGTLGVDFDPAGLIINGFAPADALQVLAPHVLHVHARDAVHDPATARGQETPLGQGAADFPTLLAILEERAYRGYVTVACGPTSQPVAEIAQAVEYLRKL